MIQDFKKMKENNINSTKYFIYDNLLGSGSLCNMTDEEIEDLIELAYSCWLECDYSTLENTIEFIIDNIDKTKDTDFDFVYYFRQELAKTL